MTEDDAGASAVLAISSDEDASDLASLSMFEARKEHPSTTGSESFGGIRIPPVESTASFKDIPPSITVDEITEEIPVEDSSSLKYRVLFEDGREAELPFDDILEAWGGRAALNAFQQHPATSEEGGDAYSYDSEDSEVEEPNGTLHNVGVNVDDVSDDELARSPRSSVEDGSKIILSRTRRSNRRRSIRQRRRTSSATQDDEFSDVPLGKRSSVRQRQLRRSAREVRDAKDTESTDSSEADEFEVFQSDLLPRKRKRMRRVSSRLQPNYDDDDSDDIKFEKRKRPTRSSLRSTRHQRNMAEASLQDTYRSDSDGPRAPPKAVVVRETFKQVPQSNPFAGRHMPLCDTCGNGSGVQGQLIPCQGCTLSYHKSCLGARTTREHLVTKVGELGFVLQCRRCINVVRRKEPTAPDHGICQTCREQNPLSRPFRPRKTAAQEEQEREENNDEDPVANVDPVLLNNVDNVLFRCYKCWRAFHFHHLVSKDDVMDFGEDDAALAEERYREYSHDWICRDCSTMPAKVSGLVAWRPIDPDLSDIDVTQVPEDAKEYLVKWEKKSYFQSVWMSGAWTWGVTATMMRRAFVKQGNARNMPIMTTEEAIPEDYLRIDIVLDIKFTSIVDYRSEEIDKARIREVDEAFVKYKGLGYEDAVWEKVPGPDDGDRWTDFIAAYNDWVVGRYVRLPKGTALRTRLEKARSQDFTTLEKKEQPSNVKGGDLMKYQLDGLNWLYYRWYSQQNAILADEMGLGKTIQVIAFLATLTQDHNCFPFLVVVPNSTCANWRREIKSWAPSLRVVAYFGSARARQLAYQHELFPEGSNTLRCHVVVTSYDAAQDESCRKFFRSVSWQGLIVDEGQRLKSDKTILYSVLGALQVPYTLLLTGTPLQNNARELFNLLQFLDANFNAQKLELEYAELTKENIPQLHDLIRPFFLRRTKAEVLTFLPPMGQVIIPVAMSVVQKKLYKSILAKNPDLLRAIFNSDRSIAKSERGNLSNLLMQLRKCLCHPFVYSKDIEERAVSQQTLHRNLVDASGKLQLLELLLPKLKARGHRVLIFSQFLDMLSIVEDFLDGMRLLYQRLDGTMGSLLKQKKIDQFNALDSELFAFLLSTRAGGVGINLATADTVIILDPDFNPHQDIQALSRAHRIGQKKKVLCFQLMTRGSAEEKIVQIGRRKMALDHVLIERMDADEESAADMESILRYGAAEILEEDSSKDPRYDDASVDKLLDRSQMEDTRAGEDQTAESQFSFARVWANDAGSMQDSLHTSEAEDRVPDPGVWDKILQEREQVAAEEAARRQQALGRGKRTRQSINYSFDDKRHSSPVKDNSDSDTDFRADEAADESPAEEHHDDSREARLERAELDTDQEGLIMLTSSQAKRKTLAGPSPQPIRAPLPNVSRPMITAPPPGIQTMARPRPPAPVNFKPFRRSNVVWPLEPDSLPETALPSDVAAPPPVRLCVACNTEHRQGYCPLKLAGPEFCNLCGLAHYGVARTCPHIRSETQVRAMLETLKQSNEPRHLVQEATRYLQGVKGTLAQAKRIIAQRTAATAGQATDPDGYPAYPIAANGTKAHRLVELGQGRSPAFRLMPPQQQPNVPNPTFGMPPGPMADSVARSYYAATQGAVRPPTGASGVQRHQRA